MVPRQSQSYMYISNAEGIVVTQGTPSGTQAISILFMYISNAEGGRCHLGYSPMVPRQSQSFLCTLVMQKGSLSPWVLPNGTQAISI